MNTDATHSTASVRPRSTSADGAVRVLSVANIMAEDRGWTRGHATLSFDDVPKTAPGFLEYGDLRLAAMQVVDPGAGYPMHPHAEVETITIMLAGSIAHDDSIGGRGVTGPSDVAVLSAGTGMQHEEMVHGSAPARAVLFWLRSNPTGQPPRFVTKTFDRAARRNRLVPLASGSGSSTAESALHIRNNASILSALLDEGANVTHSIAAGRRVYLLSTDGAIEVNGVRAEAGDRVLVASVGEADLHIRAMAPTEVIMVDLEG